MKAAGHMEAALRTDVAYCERQRGKHVMGKAVRMSGRLVWRDGYSDVIASLYQRQYDSAVRRLETWLSGRGM